MRPYILLLVLTVLAAPAGALAVKGPKAKLIDEHWLQHDEASVVTVDDGAWADFLNANLVVGPDGVNRVRYGAVTPADKAALDAYVRMLQGTDVSRLSRDAQMAYWINLYNAVTVKVVIEAYPVESIRDVLSGGFFSPGPWKRDLVTVEGRRLSLDDIEHGILRPIWQDNRIHYAVNCASIGCPNLAPTPYTAGALEEMLDAAARDYVNHPRGATVNERGRLKVSRIYNWYDADFGGNEAGVIAHLRIYAGPNLAVALQNIDGIKGYAYDWSLNVAE